MTDSPKPFDADCVRRADRAADSACVTTDRAVGPQMGMAEQRDFLLCQIDRHLRKAKAGESANRKRVRIVNPGATVFRIKNCEKALRSFRRLVERKFCLQTSKPDDFRLPAIRPRQIPKLGSPQAAAEFAKIAGKTSYPSDTGEEHREQITFAYSDGEFLVSTDGRRMVVIETDAGGTQSAPIFLNPKTGNAAGLAVEAPIWKIWKTVVPVPAPPFAILDTARFQELLSQAAAMVGENRAMDLWLNEDGTFGAYSEEQEVGTFKANVQPGATFVGTFNVDYLTDAVWIARKLGHGTVCMETDHDIRQRPAQPIVLRGATEGATPFQYVLMGIQRREAIVWSVECPGCGQTADLSVVFNGGIEASRALAGLRDYTTERYGVCPNCRKDVFVKMQTKDGDIVRADPFLKA